MHKLATTNGKKILATSFAAALLFATGCQTNGPDGNASPEATEQQTVTEPAPTVTETSTESADQEEGTTQPTGDAGTDDVDKGEPVSTSNGGYAITPVGDWQATLKQIDEPQGDGYDPVEDIELSHEAGSGAVSTGVVTSGDGPPPPDMEQLNSYRVPQLDTEHGEAYIIEEILVRPEEAQEKYFWQASVVTKTEDMESEFDGTHLMNTRLPNGAFVMIHNTDAAPGEEGKKAAEEFAESSARDEAIEMLKTLEVEQQS